MLVVDSQVHIWENGLLPPWHRQVETFSKDDLLAEMATAGVDAVLLHPPGAVEGGNELALAAAAAHPDRFAVLGHVPPDTPEASRELLEERLKQPGYLGLRYIFALPGRETWPTDGTMNWIYQVCEEKDLPLGLLAFSFLPTVAEVAERHPGLRLLIDHLGVEPSAKDDEAFETLPDLLALAKYPNVSVKLSDAPVHSSDDYPYRNIHDHMHRIFDAFGPDRCFWGTDLSREPCTYRQCVTMFTEELPWLTGNDLELVMGRALCNWIGWDLPGVSLPANVNLRDDRPTFTSHLECSAADERVPADQLHGLSAAGKPLLVRYDLAALGQALSKEALAARPADMWRYREFLPVRRPENIVSLGEPVTPLVALPNCAAELGVGEILVKDESRLPTGSFKARGLCLAVSMAKELGVTRMAMPTNGNAGAALAAYASRCGIEAFVFCPEDTPDVNVREIALQGAKVWKVNGLINDCGKIVGDGKERMGWFDTSTLKEPYRIEGKKTMGLELAEQLGWTVPDAIFYPTGGGTGLIGMWKAFAELGDIGWLDDKRPQMVCVQASGCAPMVKAWQDGADHAELWPDAHTIAAGIRVPVAIGDFLILNAVRESNGYAIAAPDAEIVAAQQEVAARDGLLMGPEGATTYAALRRAVADGRVGRDDQVVLFNCGTSLKYPMPAVDRFIDRHQPIDYDAITAG